MGKARDNKDERNTNTPISGVSETLAFHIRNSPLGVVEWDHQFRVSFWSGAAEELFGWHEQEVLGKHPEEWVFVHADDAGNVGKVMDELLSGRAPRNISSNRNYTRDGRVVHCEWYNSVLTDEDGSLISVLSLIQNVTERREMEEQLRQLQKMEAVGQLTGGVAHDFNNLLTVILGMGGLLEEGLEEHPELRRMLATMLEAAEKGAELTHQLLAFARKQALEPRPVDISTLSKSMKSLLSRTLGEQVELEYIHGSGLWPALVDPNQLESALLNLCLNARDAMPEGGRLVVESANTELDEEYARSQKELEPGEYVMIAISDTGSGITREDLEHVFDPFFTTKERDKGTGLGLSMVYGFAKQTGGHVRIYSEPGQGTTVKLYLPRHRGEDAVTDTQIKPSFESWSGSETILVVEDDEMVRDYAVAQLEKLGYRVHQARNGASALDVLTQRDDIDLLFTDVVMPGGLNGAELARKAVALRPGLRVLYASGYTENAIIHHGRLDPGIQLLSKPYQRSTLARKIRHVLSAPTENESAGL